MAGSSETTRLSKAAREFNISMNTIIEFLTKKGYTLEAKPNTKLEPEMYDLLVNEFQNEKKVKEIAHKKGLEFVGKESISIENKKAEKEEVEDEDFEPVEELIIKSSTVHFPEKTEKKEVHEEPKKETPVKDKPSEVTNETKAKPSVEELPKVDKQEVEPQETKPEKDSEAKAEEIKEEDVKKEVQNKEEEKTPGIKVVGNIDLDSINMRTRPSKKSKEEKRKEKEAKKQQPRKEEFPAKEEQPAPKKAETIQEVKQENKNQKTLTEQPVPEKKEKAREDNFIPTKVERLTGPTILDKIELPNEDNKKKKPVASSSNALKNKKKRKRIHSDNKADDQGNNNTRPEHTNRHNDRRKNNKKQHTPVKQEPSEEEIQKQIKETLARLSAPTGKSKASKYRRQKRDNISQAYEKELKQQEQEKSILKVTEFLTANELANMMSISVNDVIKTCMQLGMFVSINQRLDAETISFLADEYGYTVKFVDVDEQEEQIVEEEDDPADLEGRAPIVTVMGHVDHGKTKLLDYIRKANVVAGEAGGITQHIGAYEVATEAGKKITFLDTPGHEAFTAMRARGAKITDVAIIVIAADDSVMPQTKEAINHAQAAGVPIVFAINKVDKPTANPDRIKEQLANMNILVEDWGGKFQSQEISAITGQGIPELLEKVLLEAEILELKANPNKIAKGTVIEASLDKGRGYVAQILVQTGTLSKGDVVVAGPIYGRVKAMFNERSVQIDSAGPSTPVLLLGLTGAPQAGDTFQVMKDEREAKPIIAKRQQLMREQSIRSQKHITLDEIGRRIAIGDFKELNIIVKGDVDGSVEALSDALLKLSTEEVQVNIIHKAVGAITESDILLASASDAIIVGFQVRPVPQARKLAEKEQIDIRLYSIIYQATEEIEAAIEGMLTPKTEEKVTCNIEIRDTFKITKVGTIAGCYVLDGKINRNTRVRLIRDGIVIYTGTLGSLKRFKDDVKEVSAGYECGLNIENFNDIKVGDYIEGFEEVEVSRKK
ncbi:MAG: translation initiation factor IF-2 [Bacteroidales bacterium]|nr:translation initiation factor IF-2 [Bacteroidales bacterium]